jgi:hypothetical protein
VVLVVGWTGMEFIATVRNEEYIIHGLWEMFSMNDIYSPKLYIYIDGENLKNDQPCILAVSFD